MKIKQAKIIYVFTLSFLMLKGFTQIVLNGGGKIVFNGGTLVNNIFVVLNTPPVNPIITSGTTDGIIMEAEYNRLQYNLAATTTSIVVPYMSTALEQIPFTLIPTSAGIGAGNIRFSSIVAATRVTGWDNNVYKPSDVTNMGAPGIANNSAKTIDRFWIADANGYTTKPAVNLRFTYIDAEWAGNGGNSIAENFLRAQRFNSTVNDWQGYVGYIPAGVINTAANTVTSITVPATDFFRSWTLNDMTIPLPIELLFFNANCVNNETVLEWCTATEMNNNFFAVEQSFDGINFQIIGTLNGHGITQEKHCYSFNTNASIGTITYYKLIQVDFDGKTTNFNIISTSCSDEKENMIITNTGSHAVGVFINSLSNHYIDIHVHNTLGQIVSDKSFEVFKGVNNIIINLDQLSNGVYFISSINQNQEIFSQKIIISDLK